MGGNVQGHQGSGPHPPHLREPVEWLQKSSQWDLSAAQPGQPPHVLRACQLPSLPRPLAASWATSRQHRSSGPSLPPSVLLERPAGHSCPDRLWDGHRVSQAGRMQQQKVCLSRPALLRASAPPQAGPGTAPAATLAPQNKMTNEQKQTKMDASHPGWRRRAEAP